MRVLSSTKAISTIIVILLLILSAILGGIISYMFTIPQFIDIPERTTLAIKGVYIDEENARSFKIGVLNPSYSLTNATITRIAVSLEKGTQLYDITETLPSIEEGIAVQKGESLNITCLKIQKEGFDVDWRDFASDFAGKNMTVYVYSSDSPAANLEVTLPFVKLDISNVVFDPNVSFGNFSMTVKNADASAIDLNIIEILAIGTIEITSISPTISLTSPYRLLHGENVSFTCTGNWSELAKTNTTLTISVLTEENYRFLKDVSLPFVDVTVQNVTFNEDYTDHFNVTIYNFARQPSSYVNVTMIAWTLDNGTALNLTIPSVGIGANTSRTFRVDWLWREYRGKAINVTVILLQDSETEISTLTTPSSIIVKLLNEDEVFSLQDRTHFNITLENHASSLDAINITKIVVVETGELINGTKADPQLPYELMNQSQTQAFYCNITDWTGRAGGNLTLTIYVLANKTAEEYTFSFTFILPVAELNITEVANTEFGVTKYLNITVQSLSYSIWNLTVSKVTIKLQNQTVLAEDIVPENQTIIKPGETAVLLSQFNWEEYPNTDIVITVTTKEGVEASTTFHIP